MMLRRVCVYCGSSPGVRPAYREAARAFGALLGERGIGLVYGGGRVGLMGAVADGAMAAGGEAIGVIPDFLKQREVDHQGLTELHVVSTMHERKAKMAELSDAFVALPGGVGTLEELFEVWTWTLLGAQAKPVGLLDVDGFYGPLLAAVNHAVSAGFIQPAHRDIAVVSSDAKTLLERLASWSEPQARWMKPSEV